MTLAPLAAFTLALALPGLTASPRNRLGGPDGWSKARWGMTAKQVADSFPQAEPQSGALVIAEVPIGDITFGVSARHRHVITAAVRFTFHAIAGLQSIRLTLHEPTDEKFEALRAALNQMYGPPAFTTNMSARWDLPQTIITLAREDSEKETPSAVWLHYQSAN